MTQEDKELLLKDLCARLPYDIKVDYEGRTYYLNEINPACKEIDYITVLIQDEKRSLCATNVQIEEIKPYLRPISSMTEEEKKEFNSLINGVEERCINAYGKGGYTLAFTEVNDWLNAHHFDYRSLIPIGLALEAPEGMYNINEK